MNDIEKLRALLPHWIEHNQEHAADFESWAQKAEIGNQAEAGVEIRQAANQMRNANQALQTALEQLGGPLAMPGHDHGHSHPHDH